MRHGGNFPGRLAAALAVLLASFLWAPVGRAEEPALELAVKATYLVKFIAFVEWPASAFASPSSPLVLCVIGTPFSSVTDQAAAGEMAGLHPLAVRHIAAVERASGCAVLFTAGSAQQSVDAALDAVRGEPVLTVTDLPAAATRKGIINFVLQGSHVRFEINDREATQDGLRISSQLLSLALNANVR